MTSFFSRLVGCIGVLAVAGALAGLPTVAWAQSTSAGAQPSTLQTVLDRGVVNCGVVLSGTGLSAVDVDGTWSGFFPDLCRAVAAALFGDPEAIEFIEVDFVSRFDGLRDGHYDLLMSTATWTVRRDRALGLAFTGTVYYDGQGFLAHRSLGATNLDALEGALSVCVHDGTTTIRNLHDLIRTRYPNLSAREYLSDEGGYEAFFSRRCDLLTQDRTALLSQRQSRAPNPSDYVLFDDVISREPLGPAVREGDEAWFDVVQWVMFGLIIAEEHGITQAGVHALDPDDVAPEAARLLGYEGDVGVWLGLPPDWGYQAIAAVGHYGEVFDRNLGAGSALGQPRGINDLWTRGGLIYAPPLR